MLRTRTVRTFGIWLLAGFLVVLAAPFARAGDYPPAAATCSVDTGTAIPGQVVNVKGTQWQPDSTVTVTFDSTALTPATTNNKGKFVQQETIPTTATKGRHTITFSGLSKTGEPATCETSIRIKPASTTSAVTSAVDTARPMTALVMGGALALLLLVIASSVLRRSRT